MAAEPTPEEREKADKELKAKEDAEQAALPYKWTQTIKDVDVTIAIDGKYKGRDLDVKLTKTKLKVAIKGQEPIIEVCYLTYFLWNWSHSFMSHSLRSRCACESEHILQPFLFCFWHTYFSFEIFISKATFCCMF